jgi:hypothetical protein
MIRLTFEMDTSLAQSRSVILNRTEAMRKNDSRPNLQDVSYPTEHGTTSESVGYLTILYQLQR